MKKSQFSCLKQKKSDLDKPHDQISSTPTTLRAPATEHLPRFQKRQVVDLSSRSSEPSWSCSPEGHGVTIRGTKAGGSLLLDEIEPPFIKKEKGKWSLLRDRKRS
jgi:hypothetical protein